MSKEAPLIPLEPCWPVIARTPTCWYVWVLAKRGQNRKREELCVFRRRSLPQWKSTSQGEDSRS